jgi:excisionase family DNA binding protein
MTLATGIKDAAASLGISHWTLRAYIRTGRIKAIRIGRRLLLEASEIQRLLEQGRKDGSR